MDSVDFSGRLPLTSGQLGIWVHQQVHPETREYDITKYLDIHGAVDSDAFLAALDRAGRECGTFDVRFGEGPEGPWQRLVPPSRAPLRCADFSDAADPERAAREWVAGQWATPMVLAGDRLYDNALVKLGENAYRWYRRFHHILSDGYAAWFFERRVAAHYDALVRGGSPDPSTALGRLAGLVAADLEYRESDQFAADRDYWTKLFEQRPDPVRLSTTDRGTAGVAPAIRESAPFPQSGVDRLTYPGRGARWTWVAVTSALAAFLSRMTGTQDLTIGFQVTTRRGEAPRNTPGMVCNVLPLRVSLPRGITKSELMEQVNTRLGELLSHQRYPYDQLRRDLNLVGDGQHLSTVSLNVMPFSAPITFGEHETTMRHHNYGPIRDLSVFLCDEGGENGWIFDFEANPDLYSRESLRGHRDRFLSFLDAFSKRAEKDTVESIDLLVAGERGGLLGVG
ncbi:condensation domain-containing protein, partial [Streptomyces sodiiphilus]|uniref:condensation domain-containing protein n=1 Tax=Streptomyces sodiiphilus TaxID=226217 RepID=UPI0031DB9F1F